MNTKQYLQALVNGLDTSKLTQADSQAGGDPNVTPAISTQINTLLVAEEAAGPGTVAAFKASVNAIIAQIPD